MGKSLSAAGRQRLKRFKRFGHCFSGLIILLHGFERYDGGHAMWPVFVLAGTIFFLLGVFHRTLASYWPGIDRAFFIIEAILSFIIMGEFIHAGKSGLPYMYFIAGSAQLFGAWISWRKSIQARTHGSAASPLPGEPLAQHEKSNGAEQGDSLDA